MTKQEVIDMLGQDGAYMVHVGNDRRSITVEANNRKYDANGQLIEIDTNNEDEDLTIEVDEITHVERLN